MAVLGIIWILVVTLLVKFFYEKWKMQRLKIPYPSEYPFLIELLIPIYKLGMSTSEKRFKVVYNYASKYPDMMKLWLGPKLLVFVNSPDRIQKVLLAPQCLEKWNFFYQLMERNHGLIAASTKNKWKEHRKFFNFSFSLKILESFLPTFSKYSEIMCNQLMLKVNDGEFDFFEYSKRISFDVLCATTLGTNIRVTMSAKDYEQIFDAFEVTEAALNEKMKIPFLYPQTIFKLTKMYRMERKAQKVLLDFQHSFIEKRRQIVKKSVENNNNNDDEVIERNILVDHMILNEEKFTPQEFHDHFVTSLSGYETWANALAHSMLLLAMHPDVQDKLLEEIRSTITSKDELEVSDTVNSMRYLDMVQKEIYRMLPAVPMVLRETLEDFEIEPGLVIPKDTNLFINFYALHRRKDIWGENADIFDPERFSPENSEGRHPFAFLPFSSGTRICIAYKYSMISLKIAMIKLVETFEFRTTMKMEDLRLKSYISLKLCNNHMLSVHPRGGPRKSSLAKVKLG